MPARPFTPLSPEHLAVLRAVARMDLSTTVSLSQTLGRSAASDLASLHANGYVRKVASPRRDGAPNQLSTITPKGSEALLSQGEQPPPSPAPTTGPRPSSRPTTYLGTELQPFTARAGSNDALKYPSRVGDELRYPDGAGGTRAEKKAAAR
jgi:hypothetical protein